MAITAPRVLLESTSIRNTNIGVQRVYEGSASAQALVSGANQIADIAFRYAAEDAQQQGREMALAADPNQIVSIDPETGAPVALGQMSGMGRIGSEAYRRVIESRYSQSIEEEITNQGRILSEQFAGNPDAPTLFAEAMGNYLSSMTQHADGMWRGVVEDFGQSYIANGVSVLTAQGLRAQRARLAASGEQAIDAANDMARRAVADGGLAAASGVLGYTPPVYAYSDPLSSATNPSLSFGSMVEMAPMQAGADIAYGASTQDATMLSLPEVIGISRSQSLTDLENAGVFNSAQYAQAQQGLRDSISLGLVQHYAERIRDPNVLDLLEGSVRGGNTEAMRTYFPDIAPAVDHLIQNASVRDELRTELGRVLSDVAQVRRSEAAIAEAEADARLAQLDTYIRSGTTNFEFLFSQVGTTDVNLLVRSGLGQIEQSRQAIEFAGGVSSDSARTAALASLEAQEDAMMYEFARHMVRGKRVGDLAPLIADVEDNTLGRGLEGYAITARELRARYGRRFIDQLVSAANDYESRGGVEVEGFYGRLEEQEAQALENQVRQVVASGGSSFTQSGYSLGLSVDQLTLPDRAQGMVDVHLQFVREFQPTLQSDTFNRANSANQREAMDFAEGAALNAMYTRGIVLGEYDADAVRSILVNPNGPDPEIAPDLFAIWESVEILEQTFRGARDAFRAQLNEVVSQDSPFRQTMLEGQAARRVQEIVGAFTPGELPDSPGAIISVTAETIQTIDDERYARNDLKSGSQTDVFRVGAQAFYTSILSLAQNEQQVDLILAAVDEQPLGVTPTGELPEEISNVIEAAYSLANQVGYGDFSSGLRSEAVRRRDTILAEQVQARESVERALILSGRMDGRDRSQRQIVDEAAGQMFGQLAGSPDMRLPQDFFLSNEYRSEEFSPVYAQLHMPGVVSDVFVRNMDALAGGLIQDFAPGLEAYRTMVRMNPAAANALSGETRALLDLYSESEPLLGSDNLIERMAQGADVITQMNSDETFRGQVTRFLGHTSVRDFLTSEVPSFGYMSPNQQEGLIRYTSGRAAVAVNGLAPEMNAESLADSIQRHIDEVFPRDGLTVSQTTTGVTPFASITPISVLHDERLVRAFRANIVQTLMDVAPSAPTAFYGQLPVPLGQTATGREIREFGSALPGAMAAGVRALAPLSLFRDDEPPPEDELQAGEPTSIPRPDVRVGGLGEFSRMRETFLFPEPQESLGLFTGQYYSDVILGDLESDAIARRQSVMRSAMESSTVGIGLVHVPSGPRDGVVWQIVTVDLESGNVEPVIAESGPSAGYPIYVGSEDPDFEATARFIRADRQRLMMAQFELTQSARDFVDDNVPPVLRGAARAGARIGISTAAGIQEFMQRDF